MALGPPRPHLCLFLYDYVLTQFGEIAMVLTLLAIVGKNRQSGAYDLYFLSFDARQIHTTCTDRGRGSRAVYWIGADISRIRAFVRTFFAVHAANTAVLILILIIRTDVNLPIPLRFLAARGVDSLSFDFDAVLGLVRFGQLHVRLL